MKTVRIALLTAAAAALLAAADASAQTFQVTASVVKNCRVTSADNINISAAWDPTGALPGPVSGTISVRCTKDTLYSVDLNGGAYADQMTHTDGTTKLPYKFYADDCSTNFTPFTNITAANSRVVDYTICAGLDDGTAANVTLLEDAIEGTYADTVTVDVTF